MYIIYTFFTQSYTRQNIFCITYIYNYTIHTYNVVYVKQASVHTNGRKSYCDKHTKMTMTRNNNNFVCLCLSRFLGVLCVCPKGKWGYHSYRDDDKIRQISVWNDLKESATNCMPIFHIVILWNVLISHVRCLSLRLYLSATVVLFPLSVLFGQYYFFYCAWRNTPAFIWLALCERAPLKKEKCLRWEMNLTPQHQMDI